MELATLSSQTGETNMREATAVADTWMVVEAIPERLDPKKRCLPIWIA
jgi:hypothetical protein